MPCQREAGRGHSQDSWPKLAKGIFHTIWHHAQYINWGELAEKWLGIGRQVVSNCIVHHLFCIFFYHYYYYYYYYYYFPFLFCPIKLSLSQPTNSTVFFPILSPIPLGGSEQMAVWCLAACWVKAQQSFWHPTWGTKGWDNDRSDQSVLRQICYKHSLYWFSSCCHNVD